MNDAGLTGRRALVTGASRGLGRAIAIALADHGCAVYGTYRQAEAEAGALQERVAVRGGRCEMLRCDLTDDAAIHGLHAEVARRAGGIDILVNNAGQSLHKPLEALQAEDLDTMYHVNLRHAFALAQCVVPAMRTQGWGRLIFVSSTAAQMGGVVGPHYAAMKAATHGLAHSYARLLTREGITANVIAPGQVETDMVREGPSSSPALSLAGRYGRPEEVAQAAVLLASNGYITGQTLNVNGGIYFS